MSEYRFYTVADKVGEQVSIREFFHYSNNLEFRSGADPSTVTMGNLTMTK
jgi:hypothetical protein